MITITPATKINVTSKNLRKALSFVGGVILANPIYPLLEDVLFDAKDGALTLTGTDSNTSLSVNIPAEAEDDFRICIPHKTLLSLVAILPEQPVTITVNDLLVSVQTDTGTYNLPGEDAVSFPKKDSVGDPLTTITFDALQREHFIQSITNCLFAVAKPGLNLERMEGVCWRGEEIVATDGHRIIRTKGVQDAGWNNPILMQTKTASMLVKLSNTVDSTLPLEAVITKSRIEFLLGEHSISSPLVDERFPDYHNAIPLHSSITWQVDRLGLIGAIERVLVLANSIERKVIVTGDTSGKIMISTVEETLNQEATEKVKADVSDPLRIGFNGKFLSEALKALSGELVTLSLDAPNRALLITGDDERITSLLMPMALFS